VSDRPTKHLTRKDLDRLPTASSAARDRVSAVAHAKLSRWMRLLESGTLKLLAQQLAANEELFTVAPGGLARASGLIAVTDRRVLWFRTTGFAAEVLDIPHSEITEVAAYPRHRGNGDWGRVMVRRADDAVTFDLVSPSRAAYEIASCVKRYVG
jgi:hypothetical protein